MTWSEVQQSGVFSTNRILDLKHERKTTAAYHERLGIYRFGWEKDPTLFIVRQ